MACASQGGATFALASLFDCICFLSLILSLFYLFGLDFVRNLEVKHVKKTCTKVLQGAKIVLHFDFLTLFQQIFDISDLIFAVLL